MSEITITEIEHVAQLARLKLTSVEKQKMPQELGEIIHYVDELNQIDMAGAELVLQTSGLTNIARVDLVTNKNNREKMLQNVPEQKNGFIKTMKVFE